MRTIRGKRALVTGAGSGIGRAIAIALAREGADLILLGRDHAKLEATAEVARGHGAMVAVLRCDLTEPAEISATIKAALANAPIDILVNNAGVGYYGWTELMTDAQVGRILSTNLLAPIQLTRELLPTLLAQGEAHIVNVASIAGLITMRKGAAYQATKFGLVGFSSSLRAEYFRRGLGVSVLCPGFVRTPMLENFEVGSHTQKRHVIPAWISCKPERIADMTIRAIRSNRGLVVIAGPLRFAWWLTRLSPGFTAWLMRSGWRRK